MAKHTRNGYSQDSESAAAVFKHKSFAKWQAEEKLPAPALCDAVREMERGLINADLGGHLYKQRVARAGGGKSSGYRMLQRARINSRCFFLHAFPKSGKSNFSKSERRALQLAGRVLLEFSVADLVKAWRTGVLLEVHCGKQDR